LANNDTAAAATTAGRQYGIKDVTKDRTSWYVGVGKKQWLIEHVWQCHQTQILLTGCFLKDKFQKKYNTNKIENNKIAFNHA